MIKNRKTYLILLIFLLIILSIVAMKFGNVKITINEIYDIIINKNSDLNSKKIILFNLRFPRVLMAIIIGGGLSVVGAVFQGIYRNPMADPFIIGTSSGAALGVTISLIFFAKFIPIFKHGLMGIFAFLGAILVTFLSYIIAKEDNRIPVNNLLISGIAVNFLVSSLVSLAMIFNRSSIEDIVLWLMGSLYLSNIKNIIYIYPTIIIIILLIYRYYKELNIILLGEDEAKSVGVNVERVKKIVIILSVIAVSVMVSNVGIIGFIGMMVPHISRYIIKTSDFKWNIPLSFVIGAILMILSDTLSRGIVSNTEVPVGIITSLIGSGYFIYLLFKNKNWRVE